MDKPTKLPPVIRDVCGTSKGASRHTYHKELLCEPCRIARNARYNEYIKGYKLRNPEKVKQWAHDKYYRDPAKARAAVLRWYEKNPDWNKEYQAQYKAKNPEKVSGYQKKFRQTERGKESDRANARIRRARKRGNGQENYTEQEVLDRWGTDCHLCGEPIDFDAPRSQAKGLPGWERGLHFDHVIPIAKGGPDTLENVKPAHGKCNLKKSDN